ncbi:MAG: CHAP domain-containing protein [Actinobacteria bacterium]|nr:CHAP domain-containing protein [Actinomycetota bacterium]
MNISKRKKKNKKIYIIIITLIIILFSSIQALCVNPSINKENQRTKVITGGTSAAAATAVSTINVITAEITQSDETYKKSIYKTPEAITKETNESSATNIKFRWGDVLLPGKEWCGVDIYYNTESWNYVNGRSAYGLKWQCVEMVRRFYSQFNFGLLPGVSSAYQMFNAVQRISDFETFENGNTRTPRWGDILVFDAGEGKGLSHGHVAIVIWIDRNNKRIYFVQQNVGINAEDSLPIDDNNYISNFSSEKNVTYPPVRGWIHSKLNYGKPYYQYI